MPAEVIQLSDLCERLAAAPRKLEKRALIAGYLKGLGPQDAALAALYLAGTPFAATDGRALDVGGALLSRVLAELSEASPQAMHAAYLRRGDLGDVAYDLLRELPERREVAPAPGLTLVDLDRAFAAIAATPKAESKHRLLGALFHQAVPLEAKYLIKIILGDMRIGVKESLVEEAVAMAFAVEISAVRRAMMLNGSLVEVVEMAAEGRLAEARLKLFHPLGFMLASPIESVEAAFAQLSRKPPSLGRREAMPGVESELVETQIKESVDVQMREAQLEDKYDGIRAQIHCGDPQEVGRVALFSRSREDMTASFPEIVEAFAGFREPVVLDGEILAWDWTEGDGGRALPFSSLQPRLGRKRVSAETREAAPVIFMAFDFLYGADELMLDRPLVERRMALEALVTREQPHTRLPSRPRILSRGQQSLLALDAPDPTQTQNAAQNDFARLVLAPAIQLRSPAQLEEAFREARARGNEGLMLKVCDSIYQPGRRGLSWLKLKRELATLDVVVTAAEYGHGKRAGVLSDYTFAVRDGEALKNVGKAYSGLTDAEIARLTRFFLEHTIEDFGRVRSVEPHIVLEVAFNNVMRSDRHESGFALRFPRIVRLREDKPTSEIDTLERVALLYHSQLHH